MMAQNGAFVVLIFEAIIPTIASLVCGDQQVYFDKHQGFRLLNSVVENISVPTIPDCIYKCAEKKTLCLSINYHHGNNDVNQCHLNNRTRQSAPADDFKSDPRYTYYEKNPCRSNPCLFSGTCSTDNSNKGFFCSCLPTYKGSLCEIERIGWSSHKPAKSCSDIKSNGDAVHDGKYWIDPENSGNAIQVYCDMNHNNGGWLLISNVVIPDPVSIPSLSLRTSFRDIANYSDDKTILSASALRQLHQHINFTQLRFHCRVARVGRTVHLITTLNSEGKAVIDYFTAVSDVRPQACNSFYRGIGDTSKLADKCTYWKNAKWGSPKRVNEYRLNDHAFYVTSTYHWLVEGTNVACDSKVGETAPGDYWKIYVR